MDFSPIPKSGTIPDVSQFPETGRLDPEEPAPGFPAVSTRTFARIPYAAAIRVSG